jgi:hypothetical protein
MAVNPKTKTTSVKTATHRKLKRIVRKGAFGTISNAIDVLADAFLAKSKTPCDCAACRTSIDQSAVQSVK